MHDRVSLPPGSTDARRVGGGDINEAWRVTLADGGTAFVKTRADAGPGEYAAEAEGLVWLAEPGALRTPRVIEVGEDYLALEWIEPGRLGTSGAEELGRELRRSSPRLLRCGYAVAVWLATPVQRADRGLALLLRRAAPATAGVDRPGARCSIGFGSPRGRAGV
jgi:fructosamine-3-kinase